MITTGLVRGKAYCRYTDISAIWKKYARSMRKRRAGSELSANSFSYYVSHSAHVFFYGQSALIGQYQDNTFCVSHFAPATQKEAVRMLNAALKAEQKIVFAVTADMVRMLEKIGYRNTGITIPSEFRGKLY